MRYSHLVASCTAALAIGAASAAQAQILDEPQHEFLQAFTWPGPEGGDTIWDLAVDHDGMLFIAGDYRALHFDRDGIPEMQSMGGHDPFIMKTRLAGDGWYHSPHSPSLYNTGVAVSPDRAGGAYLAGQFEQSLQFEGGIQLGGRGKKDAYVSHYDASGRPTWAKSFGGAGADGIDDLASDADGNVYFVGGTTGEIDIDGDGRNDTSIGADGFGAIVGALSRDGTWRWLRAIDSPGLAVGNAIAASDDGGLYVSGGYRGGPLNFNGIQQTELLAAGASLLGYLARIDDGEWQWARKFQSDANTTVTALATAPNGDVLVTGRIEEATTFDGGNNPSTQLEALERTPFLARYSSTGDLMWVRAYHARDIESIAVNDRHIVLSGFYRDGPLDLNADSNPEAGEGGDGKNDGFVAILDSGGELQRAFAVVGPDGDQVRAVGLSPDGRTLWAWGFYRDAADFDGDGQPELHAADGAAGEIFGAKYRIDR